jgi:transforming growth factor-beta-induced protein
MFKLSTLMIIIILVTANMLPTALAQDGQPTIAEILQAHAQSDAPEFTLLLDALQTADSALWERLSNPDIATATFTTVFAPTDTAFTAWLTTMGLEPEDLFADTNLLTSVLSNHVMPGVFTSDNFSAEPTAYWGTFHPHTGLQFEVVQGTLKVNGANIIEGDIPALNGVIFVIDQILLPPVTENEDTTIDVPEETMWDILASREDFSIFTEAIDLLGFQLDHEVTDYTFFIPTDDVVNAFLEQVGITKEDFFANTDTLTPILFYHFLAGTFDSHDLTEMQPEDGKLLFGTQQPGTFITITTDGSAIIADNAKIVEPDIYTANGVIHVIDAVLLPSG